MNRFCIECSHRRVSKEIRLKFNEFVYPYFIDCPIDDERIVGCSVLFLNINWNSFIRYITKKKVLTEKQKKEVLEDLGTDRG